MESNENYYDQIDRFLAGRMQESERLAFEQLISTNERVAEEVRLHKGLNIVTKAYRQMELRSELNSIANRINKDNGGISHRSWIPVLWVAAAGFLLAGILFSTIYNSNNSVPNRTTLNTSLFEDHLHHYPILTKDRNRSVAEDEDFSAALLVGINHFDQKDFSSAIPAFRQIQEQDDGFQMAQYLLGLSYLHLGEAQAAIPPLKNMQQNLYATEKTWYLGMAYLKLNELPLAREQFKLVIQSENIRKQQLQSAQEILQQIE